MEFMRKITRQVLLVSFLIFAIMLIWNEVDTNHHNNSLDTPNIKLSKLPDDIAESLSLLRERAAEMKDEVVRNYDFSLDIVFLSKDKYINANTPLILQTYYKDKNKLIHNITDMPDDFVGLSVGELNSISGDWTVKEYVPDKSLILYRRSVSPGVQSNHFNQENIIIGLKDGKIAIYTGNKEARELEKVTDISVLDLPDNERKILEKGIQVYSQEELLTILEGMRSFIQD
ncbi:hypothetical protein GM661_08370 [Iocasia frigidifontis]|uniref:Bypass of forespore C C-terminal domain-containing protein n=2 Tax=Iocasia fonsfrigidae TaxID=2682810 RepID=A0A8A7KJE2_9FIRM|nr:hypothetical protein GM661_08370 [Iocasia fonsfrigidae]